MDSIQNGGHVNIEQGNYQQAMEGTYMNSEMNNYGPNTGEPGGMVPDTYTRMNDTGHPGQMPQYNAYNRPGYPNMENNMGGDYASHNTGYGQFQHPGTRGTFPGGSRPGMPPVRPGSQGMSGMMPGSVQQGYSASQQRMMSGQSISQQSGPTPTLNQLLQTPNSQPRYPNTYDGFNGPQKGPEMGTSNGPYGMPPGWMQNQRGMSNYPQMPMGGSSSYRGQAQQQNYNQQGFNQPTNAQSQYSSQGSIHQQPQPPGQPPGSSSGQQRPTPQPSPHQQVSPVPSPSPAHRLTPNPSPGPARPQPQPSPGQQRTSQPSPSPSQRSSSSQLSPPGSSPGQHNTQHNHLSSPKDPSQIDDGKGEATPMRDSSRPEPSPGSVGSRSNTPASLSGASPMPPRPPSQQDGLPNNQRMSHSPMSTSGYNQQMMPPPMGPNQMGAGYNQGNKMAATGTSYNPQFQNSQYNSGNYPMRQPGPGMGNYQQNMYNGPSQMGPGGQPMYNNMPGGPGMNRNTYNNMYGGNMMGMNNQYGNYGSGPGQNSQSVPPGAGMSSPGPSANGPQGNMNSMGSGNTGSNGPMAGPPAQGQTPIKGAQAAAQAAMAAAAEARSQMGGASRRNATPNQGGPGRIYNAGPPGMGAGPGPGSMGQHSMPPQPPMSPLSHMNQMGYNPNVNNMSPHPQNPVSPVPPNMPVGKMHNSVNNYSSEQPLPKSKSSKSKNSNPSGPPSSIQQNNLQNSSVASPNMGAMPSPGMTDSNMSGPRPSSTPASTLSDAGSQSNDSSSMGPVMNNDHIGHHHQQQGLPVPDNTLPTGGAMPTNPPSTSTNVHMEQGANSGNSVPIPNDVHQHPIRTMANNVSGVETTMTVTQSITSPVTCMSTEQGNSNDSQPVPMEPLPALQNCIPNPQPTVEETSEPPEKKKKTEGIGIAQLPFARVAPSPGGASVASSGTHEDIDNIGSPAGWSNSAKSGGTGDYMKLYDMGMEPERRPFLERLFAFLEEKGTPISNMPVISKQPIDLFRLYLIVQEKGGMVEVTKAKKWKEICGLINVSGSASAAFTLKKNYIKFLFAFECRYDRGNMDPAPILAQMENDLEKKRAAKQRNRAPSPGSQSSQDGIPNQFMQNDHNMGHMGPQGMMGNHMMNNMGPHGGPMMGPNSMGGPHHMGAGMQGPGHMMGQMGHQNYAGNTGYMMQGGPNQMIANNMGPGGPQAGMMGPGMQGPNGPMMGPGGPQQGGMMHNNIGQHGMMPGSMNMAPNNMPPNMMPGQSPGPNMPPHQPGMMPPNSMNPQQQHPMMRNNMGQPAGPNSGPMMPPSGIQNSNIPNPNTIMRVNNDSVSCQDPFADEPYQKANAGQMPFSGMPQQNSGVPQSNSPMPPSSAPIPQQNSGAMPPSSSAMMPGHMAPVSGSTPPSSMPPNSSSVMTSQNSVTSSSNSSSISTATNSVASNQQQMPPQQMPPQQMQQQQQMGQLPKSDNARLTPKSSVDMPPDMMSRPSGMSQQSMTNDQAPAMSNTNMPTSTSTSSFGSQPPQMFSQDSNSNSSMGGEFVARSMENSNSSMSSQQAGPPVGMPPQAGPQGGMPQQAGPQGGMPQQAGPQGGMPQQAGPQQAGPQGGMPQHAGPQGGMPQQAGPPGGMPPQVGMQQQGMPSQPGMLPQQGMPHQSVPQSMPQAGMPQSMAPGGMPPTGQDVNSSSQVSNTTNTTSSTGRQFPFGDNQFNKPDRFDQGSPSLSQSGPTPMSQAPMMNPPPMSMSQAGPISQGAPMNQGSMAQQAPMNQGAMNYPSGGPVPPYMNPQQQQPGMDQPGYRYGSQGQPGQDQYNQGYHGNGPQGNYGPRPPMMNNEQGYQGYPNQYGKSPMGRDMQHGMYTPNKRYPDNRNDIMSPAFNNRGGSMGYNDQMGQMYTTPSRPHYPDMYGVESNIAAYGSQPYSGSSTASHGDPNTSQYQSAPPQSYSDYNDTSSLSVADGSGRGQWSPMMQRPYNQQLPPYGPSTGMTPTGPPNMMSRGRNLSPTPTRMRDYPMSPNNKPKMGHPPGIPFKKDTHFPIDCVESTHPLLGKKRRLTKHDVGQIEAWRIMMSLRSGLMAESTWALDTLNILLYDESTVSYFGLSHLPGLLEVLLDHLRRCLIEMFDLFEDSQIGSGHEDFKQSLVRMAILETAKECTDDTVVSDAKEINRANKTIVKIENSETDDWEEMKVTPEPIENTENNSAEVKVEEDGKNDDDKENERSSPAIIKRLKSRKNYTHITRQGKEVKLEEGSELDGLLDEKYWDVYGEFGDQSDLWEIGKGDLTEHIFTHLEDVNEHKRCSRRFFRRPMKRKAESDLNIENEPLEDGNNDDKLSNTGAIKEERLDTESSIKDTESEVQSNNDNSDNEKCETSSETTDCSCEKDHTCNRFMKSVSLKTEPRDLLPERTDSNDGTCDEKLGLKSFFRDEPRIKLAVKYELLDNNELVQMCKTQFGLNTEGERNSVEDESYQRNDPPLCLTSEAQHELGRRCICISNIFRSMSFIPSNDIEMSRHSGLVYILGKLLLLHHKHLPRSRARRKFDRDDIEEDMVDTSQGMDEWWWDCLNVLRENTLVIFANICAQLRLDTYPDEICKPVLDGLLHWVVCPSSCASDPLPTVGATSVLSPLRLVLEALCKLCIHDKNVDMLLGSPPYERIVQLFSVLTKLLANKSEQVTMEFSVVLLSELVRGGSSAARGVALQHPSISLLIDFIETAEQKAVQVANMHTVQMLRDNPEMMGTSLDMLRRAATVLVHLAKVPENRKLFVHHQSRLLSLVMSQILDHNVASLLSDVLFQCSSLS